MPRRRQNQQKIKPNLLKFFVLSVVSAGLSYFAISAYIPFIPFLLSYALILMPLYQYLPDFIPDSITKFISRITSASTDNVINILMSVVALYIPPATHYIVFRAIFDFLKPTPATGDTTKLGDSRSIKAIFSCISFVLGFAKSAGGITVVVGGAGLWVLKRLQDFDSDNLERIRFLLKDSKNLAERKYATEDQRLSLVLKGKKPETIVDPIDSCTEFLEYCLGKKNITQDIIKTLSLVGFNCGKIDYTTGIWDVITFLPPPIVRQYFEHLGIRQFYIPGHQRKADDVTERLKRYDTEPIVRFIYERHKYSTFVTSFSTMLYKLETIQKLFSLPSHQNTVNQENFLQYIDVMLKLTALSIPSSQDLNFLKEVLYDIETRINSHLKITGYDFNLTPALKEANISDDVKKVLKNRWFEVKYQQVRLGFYKNNGTTQNAEVYREGIKLLKKLLPNIDDTSDRYWTHKKDVSILRRKAVISTCRIRRCAYESEADEYKEILKEFQEILKMKHEKNIIRENIIHENIAKTYIDASELTDSYGCLITAFKAIKKIGLGEKGGHAFNEISVLCTLAKILYREAVLQAKTNIKPILHKEIYRFTFDYFNKETKLIEYDVSSNNSSELSRTLFDLAEKLSLEVKIRLDNRILTKINHYKIKLDEISTHKRPINAACEQIKRTTKNGIAIIQLKGSDREQGEQYGECMREEIVKMANAFAKFLLQHPTLDYRTISDKSDEYFTEHKILSQDKKSFIVGVSANSSFSVQDCKIFSVFGYLLHEDRKQKYNATSYFFGSMLGLQYDYQLFYEYMDIHSNYRQNPLTVTIFDNATSIISFPLELHCSLCINKYGLIASARLHNDVNLSNFSALGSTNLCLKHNITAIKEVECDNSNISQIINTTCHPSPGISSLEQLQQILIPADQNLHDVAVIIVPSTLTLLYCTNNTWNNLSLFGESTDFNL